MLLAPILPAPVGKGLRSLSFLLRFLLLGPLLPIAPVSEAAAEPRAVTTVPLPAPSGVALEARTIIDAPPARVAQVAGDPAFFPELLSALEVRVVGSEGPAQLLSVLRREPWPVGDLRWVEVLSRRREGDGTLVVERRAHPGPFFRRMEATWRLDPLPGDPGRTAVTYQVAIDITRWAPLWMLRRSHRSAVLTTVERLRRISERPAPPRS